MKEKTKNTPQVLARRAVLVLLDALIVAFSFYFALLLRADGAVEAAWWPHNRAILYANLPWIVAVYVACFLAGGLYSVQFRQLHGGSAHLSAGGRQPSGVAVVFEPPAGRTPAQGPG